MKRTQSGPSTEGQVLIAPRNDNGKKIYRAITEAARRLDNSRLNATAVSELFEPHIEIQRIKLRDSCEKLLFSEPLLFGRKSQELLWRKSYYDVINTAKKLLHRRNNDFDDDEDDEGRRRHDDALCVHNHIDSGIGYYNFFLFRLQNEFGIDLNGVIDFPVTAAAGGAGKREQLSNEVKKWACLCAHSCLVSLGDLTRYKCELDAAWSADIAKVYYKQAIHLDPRIGMPYNQLGTLSGSKNYHLDAVYYYAQCLLSPQTFDGAETNLKIIFDKNRAYLRSLKQRPDEQTAITEDLDYMTHVKMCIARFLYLFDVWLFNKPQPDNYDSAVTTAAAAAAVNINDLCHAAIGDLKECILYMEPLPSEDDEQQEEDTQDSLGGGSRQVLQQLLRKQNSKNHPEYMDPDILFELSVLCVMCVQRLQDINSSHVSLVKAFTLAVFLELIDFVIGNINDALHENNDNGHNNDDTAQTHRSNSVKSQNAIITKDDVISKDSMIENNECTVVSMTEMKHEMDKDNDIDKVNNTPTAVETVSSSVAKKNCRRRRRRHYSDSSSLDSYSSENEFSDSSEYDDSEEWFSESSADENRIRDGDDDDNSNSDTDDKNNVANGHHEENSDSDVIIIEDVQELSSSVEKTIKDFMLRNNSSNPIDLMKDFCLGKKKEEKVTEELRDVVDVVNQPESNLINDKSHDDGPNNSDCDDTLKPKDEIEKSTESEDQNVTSKDILMKIVVDETKDLLITHSDKDDIEKTTEIEDENVTSKDIIVVDETKDLLITHSDIFVNNNKDTKSIDDTHLQDVNIQQSEELNVKTIQREDDFFTHTNNINKRRSNRRRLKPEQIMNLIDNEPVLASIKILCDWLRNDTELIKSCAQNTPNFLQRLLTLLNLINLDLFSKYYKERNGTKINISGIKSTNLDVDYLKQTNEMIPLTEDFELRGLSILQNSQDLLDWDYHKTQGRGYNNLLMNYNSGASRFTTPREENLVRVLKLVNFGFHVAKIKSSGVEFNSKSRLFIMKKKNDNKIRRGGGGDSRRSHHRYQHDDGAKSTRHQRKISKRLLHGRNTLTSAASNTESSVMGRGLKRYTANHTSGSNKNGSRHHNREVMYKTKKDFMEARRTTDEDENADGENNETAENIKDQTDLMEHMGRLWLRAQVRSLESDVRRRGADPLASLLVSPYLVVDAAALTLHAHKVRQIATSRRAIVLIPSVVLSSLDLLKHECTRAREAIRWLEGQLRKGNRNLRAQRPHEHAPVAYVQIPKKIDRESRDYVSIIEFCNYFIGQKTRYEERDDSGGCHDNNGSSGGGGGHLDEQQRAQNGGHEKYVDNKYGATNSKEIVADKMNDGVQKKAVKLNGAHEDSNGGQHIISEDFDCGGIKSARADGAAKGDRSAVHEITDEKDNAAQNSSVDIKDVTTNPDNDLDDLTDETVVVKKKHPMDNELNSSTVDKQQQTQRPTQRYEVTLLTGPSLSEFSTKDFSVMGLAQSAGIRVERISVFYAKWRSCFKNNSRTPTAGNDNLDSRESTTTNGKNYYSRKINNNKTSRDGTRKEFRKRV